MAAASRNSCLGAAIFGGAAAVSGMLAMLIWFPLRPDHQLGLWLWSVAKAGIAAGISAGLSFAVLNRMGWRLRRGSSLAQATVLGTATVAGAHLLVGVVSALLLLIEGAVLADWRFDFSAIPILSFFIGLFSVMFVLMTIPLGIAAAALVGLLERRREAKERVSGMDARVKPEHDGGGGCADGATYTTGHPRA